MLSLLGKELRLIHKVLFAYHEDRERHLEALETWNDLHPVVEDTDAKIKFLAAMARRLRALFKDGRILQRAGGEP